MSKGIKFLVMDVDGTLTDGKIYMGAKGEIMKAFSIKDGYGIHDMLPSANIQPVIITGRSSKIVIRRCKELGIVHLFQGVSRKIETLCQFIESQRSSLSEVAYIGDDLNDMGCMELLKKNGGLVGVPSDAKKETKEVADFIAESKGGDGAVREFIEYLISISKSNKK